MNIESINLELNGFDAFYIEPDEEPMNKKTPLFELEVPIPRRRRTLHGD